MMSFFSSKSAIALPEHNCILPHALRLPIVEKLTNKRVVLASNSPRRKDILLTYVLAAPRRYLHQSDLVTQGLAPEIVPSTFDETLPIQSFKDPHEYPVATATHKAVEVYERLVVSVDLNGRVSL